MHTTTTGRYLALSKPSRLFSAVLIAAALLLSAGCSSASTNQAADQSAADLNTPAGSLVVDPIKTGTNPFETAGIQDPQAMLDTFAAVKTAVASDNKAEVASHILYPLRVNGASGHQLIQTRGDFVDQYDAIMTKQVKAAIAGQTADHLFVNYQGVMVGNGELWFGASADSPQVIGIIAINHDIAD